jgi:sensor c-di-GMP phosphodiesterase-like protein
MWIAGAETLMRWPQPDGAAIANQLIHRQRIRG